MKKFSDRLRRERKSKFQISKLKGSMGSRLPGDGNAEIVIAKDGPAPADNGANSIETADIDEPTARRQAGSQVPTVIQKINIVSLFVELKIVENLVSAS